MRPVLFVLAGLYRAAAEFAHDITGCVMVSKSVGVGHFVTIQRAIDSLPTNSTQEQCIAVLRGTYYERILIPFRRNQLSLFGETAGATRESLSNLVTISATGSTGCVGNMNQSFTVHVSSPQFRMYNVNVVGRSVQGDPETPALLAEADSGYYGCQFFGRRAAVHSGNGKHLYSRCSLHAESDLVLGHGAKAWFERNELRLGGVPSGCGYVAATRADPIGAGASLVFNRCNVSVADGTAVRNLSYFLGHTLGGDARVIFQRTQLPGAINPAGWKTAAVPDPPTHNVTFGEYQNLGPGSRRTRANLTKDLEKSVSLTEILGKGYFLDGFFDADYM